MPKRKTISEQFISFLQSKLGEQVEVPQTTDVLRIAQYPGLESKAPEPMDESFGGMNFGGSMGGQPLPDLGMPMPGDEPPAMGGLTDDLLD